MNIIAFILEAFYFSPPPPQLFACFLHHWHFISYADLILSNDKRYSQSFTQNPLSHIARLFSIPWALVHLQLLCYIPHHRTSPPTSMLCAQCAMHNADKWSISFQQLHHTHTLLLYRQCCIPCRVDKHAAVQNSSKRALASILCRLQTRRSWSFVDSSGYAVVLKGYY